MPALALFLPAFQVEAQETAPVDVFIGMVTSIGNELVLERCDLGRTRYLLRAAQGVADPFVPLLGNDGEVQAHVFARYRAEGETHVLDVTSIDIVRSGKTCHLLDAVDEAFSMAEAKLAASPDEQSWQALAAGAAALSGTGTPGVETIGIGEHVYRFVLIHPRTGRPSPHTDFALSASRTTDYELPFVTDQKKVFQGRTDAEGRTPIFRLPVRLPDSAFDLRERFGSGPFGETFHLADHNGNDLFDTPYLLMTCTSTPRYFRGYTYPNGDTAYTASDGPINIQLRVLVAMDDALPTSCDDERNNEGDHVALPTTSGLDRRAVNTSGKGKE